MSEPHTIVSYEVHCQWPLDINGRRAAFWATNRSSAASWDSTTREWPNMEQAIRSAKALHRLHRVPVDIAEVRTTPKHRHFEAVARVSRDSAGRVWTDLTWEGAKLL